MTPSELVKRYADESNWRANWYAPGNLDNSTGYVFDGPHAVFVHEGRSVLVFVERDSRGWKSWGWFIGRPDNPFNGVRDECEIPESVDRSYPSIIEDSLNWAKADAFGPFAKIIREGDGAPSRVFH